MFALLVANGIDEQDEKRWRGQVLVILPGDRGMTDNARSEERRVGKECRL